MGLIPVFVFVFWGCVVVCFNCIMWWSVLQYKNVFLLIVFLFLCLTVFALCA